MILAAIDWDIALRFVQITVTLLIIPLFRAFRQLQAKVSELVNQQIDQKLTAITAEQKRQGDLLGEHAMDITKLKQHRYLSEGDGMKLFVTEPRFAESEKRRDAQLNLIAQKQDRDLADNAAQTQADKIILDELRDLRKRIDRKFDGGK